MSAIELAYVRVGLAIGFLSFFSSFGVSEDKLIADFEGGYGEWTIEGNAFGDVPARGKLGDQQDVLGFRGNGLVNTFLDEDTGTGTLTSPEFKIEEPYISFLIGGGKHPGKTGMELLVDGKSVRSATGKNQEMLSWHTWDVSSLKGKLARLRIFDQSTDGFGHINVDHIVATNLPRKGAGVLRLSDYAKTDDYYRERYRPQYHFTPPMNWMNDPNGLVYFEGEYHLFYQHNPHGNSWGHMSWGHAVSKDLVHWKHLPIALHEEYGVMVFSGCCVVDHENTSGFGSEGKPPMVAIYTGHGLGKQTQDVAYSTDRGRTWTKYSGNPVLDKNEADFRDPKVFWHQPTNKWVMVVSMANEKFVEFYSSDDLKTWKYLSKFGPAGVKNKPNWECPDLFELPIENEPGKSRWVLEVDMGNGSVAGGSGGEYFVGHFDGREFTCNHDITKSQWVDYGRDFYAPVSFSDIPKSDGRRIWIGWMNNWETNNVPTRPWRSAMSIPRTLTLKKKGDSYALIQKPVKELESLRRIGAVAKKFDVDGELRLHNITTSNRVEIKATLDVLSSRECGLKFCVGDSEQTLVGYDSKRKEVFVDRTKSGESDFHSAFAGKHRAPFKATDGRVDLRVFLDDSSIEVFVADGEVVLTDRIFPDPKSQGFGAFSKGGKALIESLEVFQLRSIWHDDE